MAEPRLSLPSASLAPPCSARSSLMAESPACPGPHPRPSSSPTLFKPHPFWRHNILIGQINLNLLSSTTWELPGNCWVHSAHIRSKPEIRLWCHVASGGGRGVEGPRGRGVERGRAWSSTCLQGRRLRERGEIFNQAPCDIFFPTVTPLPKISFRKKFVLKQKHESKQILYGMYSIFFHQRLL